MKEEERRVGDMHPTRELKIRVQKGSSDIVVTIDQNGLPIGDTEIGDPRQHTAQVEYVWNGGRSPHTRAALFALMEAMEKDNEERPTPGEPAE